MWIHRRIILPIAIFVVTLLSFARLTTCEFTWWDDQDTVHQNPRLNPPTLDTLGYYWTNAGEHTTMGLYVPVTYTLWSGLAKIARLTQPDAQGLTLSAFPFHTANVLIHAITAVLVFQLLFRLFGNHVAAAIGALLFALHPVQVESVGWVSGTKDLLCGFWSISALLMYVRSVQIQYSIPAVEASPAAAHRWPARWRYLLGLLFFVLGMLSKPTAVVLPLMAATLAIWILDRPARKTILSLMPWLVLMIPCLIWTKLVQPATWVSPLPLWARPAVAADAIAFYLYKLVWPMHLCIDYGHNPQAIVANRLIYFSWVLPAIVIATLWRRSAECRPLIGAAILFALPLTPVLGFVGFEFQQLSTTSDHYLYLPLLGVAVAAAWAVVRYPSRKNIQIAMVLLAALGLRTILQEPTWQNTRSLFQHALQVNPSSVASCDGMGFLTGREARRTADPKMAKPLFDESIRWYQRSLTLEPTSVPSLYNLALDYKAIGHFELGKQQMRRIVQLQPQLPERLRVTPIDLAHRLYDFGDLEGAIDLLDSIVRKNPGDRQSLALRERAILQMQTNK